MTKIIPSHIYSFKYDYHHSELCKLESRQVFNVEEKNNQLFSDVKVDPSISPFVKSRFDILFSSAGYQELLQNIKNENIRIDGFKVEYLKLNGDTTEYPERLKLLKDIGYCIEGEPDYNTPSIIYSICYFENVWYFGILSKNNATWRKHKNKPCSFSNSIGMSIAKVLVSVASKGDQKNRLLDACCGVGTVLLEACFSGFDIEGCDINLKAYNHTIENLAHYNYKAHLHHLDIKDLDKKYDAAIIDLPYNLYAPSTEANTLNIISSTAQLANRIIIVSISDIEPIIKQSGLMVSDFCTVEKRGQSGFTRNIWVCESC